MHPLTLAGISVGLAMDAFAVSVSLGLCGREPVPRRAARVAAYFGLFQTGMTLGGYLAGWTASGWLHEASHWIASGLLWAVGLHMLVDVIRGHRPQCDAQCAPPEEPRAEDAATPDPGRGVTLLILAVATSIDAFGVGMSFAFLRVPILIPSIVIGVVAAVISAFGVATACCMKAAAGRTASRGAEIAGALVLIGIGVKIALEAGA